MELYAVYDTNEDGGHSYIESYWLNYDNAVARFKKIWPYIREPFQSEIDSHVRQIMTKD